MHSQQGWILPLVLVILMLLMLTTTALLQQGTYLLTAASESHRYRQAYLASLPRVCTTHSTTRSLNGC
jgi:hypothetical protein